MVKMTLRTYLNDALDVTDIEDDTALIDMGYLDSMQALELAMFVANEFDIELTHEDLRVENFSSLQAVEDFVNRRKSA